MNRHSTTGAPSDQNYCATTKHDKKRRGEHSAYSQLKKSRAFSEGTGARLDARSPCEH